MAFGSDIAKLLASLDLDTKPFESGAKRVGTGLDRMEGGMGRVSTRTIALGSAIGTGIERLAEKGIDLLFDSLRTGEEGLRVLQDATAQTNAVIESTGGAAGQTAASVRALAEELENLTTADDKAIQQGENLLLTFTNIGADVFPDATKAMVNMAIAMNKGNAETADFDATAVQLGKALNDPIKGITALTRVGVQFTEDQKDQIETLVEAGDVMGAQKVILAELTKEFGKAGEAAGQSEAAGLRRFNDAIEDSQIALAQGMAPALQEIRAEITTGINSPQFQQGVRDLGRFLGDAAKSGLEFAKSVPWGQIADGLKTAAGFAGNLIKAFANLPPGVQATIIGLAGLNKLAGGGVIRIGVDLFKEGAKGLLGQFFQRGGSPAAPMFTKEVGLPAGGGGSTVVPGGKGGIGTLGKFFLAAEGIGLILAVKDVADSVTSAAHQQATGIHETLTESLAGKPTVSELQTKLAGIDQGIKNIKDLGNIPEFLFQDTIKELQMMRTEVVAAINDQKAETAHDRADKFDRQELANLRQIAKNTKDDPDETSKKQQKHFDRLRDRIETTNIRTNTRIERTNSSLDRVRDRVESARIAVQTGTDRVAERTSTAADRIVAAVNALKLVSNVVVNVAGTTAKSYESNGQYGNKVPNLPSP